MSRMELEHEILLLDRFAPLGSQNPCQPNHAWTAPAQREPQLLERSLKAKSRTRVTPWPGPAVPRARIGASG